MKQVFDRRTVKIKDLEFNTGQLPGLPKNPRFIRDDRFDLICKSIREDPEFLEVREPLLYETESGTKIVIAGEMRIRAAKENGMTSVTCKIFPASTTIEKLKAYAIKDNAHYGEWDMDELANEWGDSLSDWGVIDRTWHPANEMSDNDVDIMQEFDPIGLSGDIQRVVFLFDNKGHADKWLEKIPDITVKKGNNAWQVNLSTLYI